jgi:hypothetical protein
MDNKIVFNKYFPEVAHFFSSLCKSGNLNYISLQGGLLMNVSCVFHLICFALTKSDGGDLAIV